MGLKNWIKVDGSRRAVTVVFGSAIFLFLTVVGLNIAPEGTNYLFSSLITSILTVATIVVTINQLVISQQQGPPGEQKSRMEGAMDFQREAEGLIERPAPPKLSNFVYDLANDISDKAERFREVTRGEPYAREAGDIADELHDQEEAVKEKVEDSSFGDYRMVQGVLAYNYGRSINDLRNFIADKDLDDEESEAAEKTLEALFVYGPLRQHIKTLYFQWELVSLSNDVLYAALTSISVAVWGLLYFDPGAFSDPVTSIILAALVAVSLLPFLLVASFILRIGTVAKYTLNIGPSKLTDQPEIWK